MCLLVYSLIIEIGLGQWWKGRRVAGVWRYPSNSQVFGLHGTWSSSHNFFHYNKFVYTNFRSDLDNSKAPSHLYILIWIIAQAVSGRR